MTIAEQAYWGIVRDWGLCDDSSAIDVIRGSRAMMRKQVESHWFGRRNRKWRHAMLRTMLHWHDKTTGEL